MRITHAVTRLRDFGCLKLKHSEPEREPFPHVPASCDSQVTFCCDDCRLNLRTFYQVLVIIITMKIMSSLGTYRKI